MTPSSAIKKAYEAVSLFALLNMVTLGGVFCFLVASGALNAEKIRAVAAVLRGSDEMDGDVRIAEESAPRPEEDSETEAGSTAAGSVAESQTQLEMIRREADRIKEELRQRLALNNAILLKVTTERESFRAEREAFARQDEAKRADRDTEGFAKQVAIYEGLAPKTALRHLLGLEDVDEAAAVLRAMKTRSAKKIVAAAKSGAQMNRMMTILQRLRETAPARSTEIAGR